MLKLVVLAICVLSLARPATAAIVIDFNVVPDNGQILGGTNDSYTEDGYTVQATNLTQLFVLGATFGNTQIGKTFGI